MDGVVPDKNRQVHRWTQADKSPLLVSPTQSERVCSLSLSALAHMALSSPGMLLPSPRPIRYGPALTAPWLEAAPTTRVPAPELHSTKPPLS